MSLTLDTTQSLLPYAQYEPWEFNPGVLNLATTTPAQWAREENFARRLPDATVATTANLTSTYSNGTSGVGATLTATSNVALTIDGTALFVGDRVCVKNQSASSQNGLYKVTDAGSSGAPWVLTRDESMDSTAEFVGFVLILVGSTNKGRIYLCPPNQITVGESAVTFEAWPNLFMFSGLPSGVVGNIATGRISGPGTIAGASKASIRGSNNAGTNWGDPIYVTIGIDPRPAPARSGIDLRIDVRTRTVSGVPQALKFGDDFLFPIQFEKDGKVIDLGELKSLKLAVKETDQSRQLVLGGGVDSDSPLRFIRTGSGEDAVYSIYGELKGAALKSAIMDGQESGGMTYLDAICEIEWQEPNEVGIGPTHLRFSSASFVVRLYLDLVSNT